MEEVPASAGLVNKHNKQPRKATHRQNTDEAFWSTKISRSAAMASSERVRAASLMGP